MNNLFKSLWNIEKSLRVLKLFSIFIFSSLSMQGKEKINTNDTHPHGVTLSVSTNILNYINFATINAEIGLSFHKNIAITLSGKYNPFVYNKHTPEQVQNKRIAAALGIRYWPWFENSGWFLSSKLQGEVFNTGGYFLGKSATEGTRIGVGMGAGYAIMLSAHFNLEVGFGFWMGYENFTKYACPSCGKCLDEGRKMFILPNDLLLNFIYIF